MNPILRSLQLCPIIIFAFLFLPSLAAEDSQKPHTQQIQIGQDGRLNIQIDQIPPRPRTAREPSVSVQMNPTECTIGQPVEYTVTITGDESVDELKNFQPPDGLDFEALPILSGIRQVNRQTTYTTTMRYKVTPLKTGKFILPSFLVSVGNREILAPESTLIVRSLADGETPYQPASVVLDLPKRDFFIGETIKARVLVFQTPNEVPKFIGAATKKSSAIFLKSHPKSIPETTQVTWKGVPRIAAEISVEITPILTGDLQLSLDVPVQIARSFSGKSEEVMTAFQTVLSTDALSLKVLAVPQAERPQGFTGAVGKFQLGQPQLSSKEVEVGEPVVMKVPLTGLHDVENVPPPEALENADWAGYRPISQFEKISENRGVKTFTFTLVPKRDGPKSTPPVPFAYFDPEKRAFVDLTIPPMPITVKPSAAISLQPPSSEAQSEMPSEPPREAELALTGLAEKSGNWSQPPSKMMAVFLYAQIAPPLILLAAWAWRRRHEYLAAHPEILRRRRARAAVRRALASAKTAARRGDQSSFLQAAITSLREAASPLDSAEASSLTREEVLKQLQGDSAALAAATAIFDSSDALRYAQGNTESTQFSQHLPGLLRAIQLLEVKA